MTDQRENSSTGLPRRPFGAPGPTPLPIAREYPIPVRPPSARSDWSYEPPVSEPSGMSAGEYLAVLLRYWWLLLIVPLVLGTAAYAYFTVAGRTYTASAILLVHPLSSGVLDGPPDVQAAILLARSYGRLASSPDVLAGTAFTLGLQETALTLEPKVKTRVEAETQLITISVDDRDPARAAALANAIGATFIRWIGDRTAAVGGDPVRVSLVGPADVPTQAKGLSTAVYVVLAIVLGLALAALAAYVLDRLDRRIWNARDVSRAVDLPVVARLSRGWRPWARSRLVTVSAPLSRASDGFRSLWIKLGLSVPDDTLKAIVVTSPGPASGKSSIAANLAISIAQSGQRVVLVDANLRSPSLDRLFQLPDRAGLSNLLAGAGGWISDHLVDGPVPELKLMLAGSMPKPERDRFAVRPLELATAIELLVAALHTSGDLVVVDAPPMLDASEALVFAAVASRLVVVVQEGQTRPEMLTQALDDIRSARTGAVSLVLADAAW